MNEADLRAKGFTRQTDGSWSKRPDALGALETGRSKQSPIQTLEHSIKKRSSSKRGVEIRVSIVSYRRRFLDPDAVAASCKPLTDAIAQSLGIDDADPICEWEWMQVKTSGSEGISVKLESIH